MTKWETDLKIISLPKISIVLNLLHCPVVLNGSVGVVIVSLVVLFLGHQFMDLLFQQTANKMKSSYCPHLNKFHPVTH